jgi:hypothetical protein
MGDAGKKGNQAMAQLGNCWNPFPLSKWKDSVRTAEVVRLVPDVAARLTRHVCLGSPHTSSA